MKLILLALAATLLRAQEPAGVIEGAITDALSRSPIPGARVALRGPAPDVATSSATGSFRFDHLPPGEYNLTVVKPGYVDSAKGSVHQDVTLKPGAITESAPISLTPLGALEGAVLDEDNKPLAGVYVTVAGLSVPIAKDGRFAFEDLIPDSYQIAVSVPHAVRSSTLLRDESTGEFYGYAPAQYYPGASDPRLAIPVQVSAGARLRNVDLRLRRTHLVEFTGLLTDLETGKVLMGEVQLIGSIPGTPDPLWRKRPPGSGGAFRFSLLEPGSYKLAVYRSHLSPLPYIIPIELGKAGAEDMRISVPPFTNLQGRLVVSDPKLEWRGTPRMTLRTHDKITTNCETQPNGVFECANVPPGELFIDVQLGVGNAYDAMRPLKDRTRRLSVKELRFGDQNGLHRPVRVAENGNPPIEVMLTDEPAGVAGKVIDELSKTSYYSVAVSSLSTHAIVSATVGPPDFQIPELAPGDYEITAFRGGPRLPLIAPGQGCAETQKITVREGAFTYVTLRPCK